MLYREPASQQPAIRAKLRFAYRSARDRERLREFISRSVNRFDVLQRIRL